MALLFASSLSQYLSQAAALVTSLPASFACWYMPTNNTGTQGLFSVCNNSAASYLDMDVNAGNERGIFTQSGHTALSATSAGSLIASAWNHVAVVFTTTQVTVYVNGTATAGSTGTALALSGLGITLCGALDNNGTISEYSNGAIAYSAAWTGYAITSTDDTTLYNGGAGSDPRLLGNPPNASFSLLQGSAPFLDSVSGVNWTIHGSPTVVADPFSLGTTTVTLTSLTGSIGVHGLINPTLNFPRPAQLALLPTYSTYLLDGVTPVSIPINYPNVAGNWYPH